MMAISGATTDNLSLILKVIEAAKDRSIVKSIEELLKATAEHDAALKAAAEANQALAIAEADIKQRLENLNKLEAEYAQRSKALEAQEADYNRRIDTLRGIVR